MQHTLLICNDFAIEKCASLQPNSRLWQTETGTSPVSGFNASPSGYLLDSRVMRVARGVMRPIDSLAINSIQGVGDSIYTGRTGTLAMNPFAFDGKLGFAEDGGIMRKDNRPADQEIGISTYNNGSSGTIGNLNKLHTGIHSRLGGLPPQSRASAPPGRDSADPGGGRPTAS